ncbi:MAG: hypothetical protein ABIG90_00270 [bacterium]
MIIYILIGLIIVLGIVYFVVKKKGNKAPEIISESTITEAPEAPAETPPAPEAPEMPSTPPAQEQPSQPPFNQ